MRGDFSQFLDKVKYAYRDGIFPFDDAVKHIYSSNQEPSRSNGKEDMER